MPMGEVHWNPYRWVVTEEKSPTRSEPYYHDRIHKDGIFAKIEGVIKTRSPIFVADPKHKDKFLTNANGVEVIPATSLKGSIRSIFEHLSNSADPFMRNSNLDEKHRGPEAVSQSTRGNLQIDQASRAFGIVDEEEGASFLGHVRFHDARLVSGDRGVRQRILVGSPKVEHKAFYKDSAPKARKYYHHRHDGELATTDLPTPHSNVRTIAPIPAGATFDLRVDVENLQEELWSILLYSLVLENEVTVTLSIQALGPNYERSETLNGPMLHKLGGAKPQGCGSAQIRLKRILLEEDPMARYRGRKGERTIEGSDLEQYVEKRTELISRRKDILIQQLRAMLVFDPRDPRANDLRYPDYDWFDGHPKTRLKPTL